MLHKTNIIKFVFLFIFILGTQSIYAQKNVTVLSFDEIEFLNKSGKLNGGAYRPKNGGLIHWHPESGGFGIQAHSNKREIVSYSLDLSSLRKVKQSGNVTEVYFAKNNETDEDFRVEYTSTYDQYTLVLKPVLVTSPKAGRLYRCKYLRSYGSDN